ncbi:hypothetical protein pdam_00010972, partial [Pocillopora damicornis]
SNYAEKSEITFGEEDHVILYHYIFRIKNGGLFNLRNSTRCGFVVVNCLFVLAALDSTSELSNPLDTWRKEDQDNVSPVKTLQRNDEFMDKLLNSYIMSTVEQFDLNCTAARVLLNAMPGLESAAVFQDM